MRRLRSGRFPDFDDLARRNDYQSLLRYAEAFGGVKGWLGMYEEGQIDAEYALGRIRKTFDAHEVADKAAWAAYEQARDELYEDVPDEGAEPAPSEQGENPNG